MTKAGGALLDANVQAQVGDRAGYAFQVVQDRLRLTDQALERIARAGIADDEIRVELAAIGHFDAGGLAVLNDDLLDIGADDYFPAVALDQRSDGFGDACRASDGIAGAVEIVAGNDGVNSETALGGRQAVVAPLGGEDGDELWISREMAFSAK